MNYLALISVSFIVLSAILVAIGWVIIARDRRDIEKHKKVMTAAAVAATTFFILYVSRTIFVGNTAFGGPDSIKPYYLAFMIFHILLATTGGVLGLITLYLGYKNKVAKHRKIAPKASVVWFFTAITGVTVYVLLYVAFEPGETTNVFRAIIGG
ncbi:MULTISPECIES: DUF420 domain-containing protein [Exiguobacterium]|mgnify:FL=1|uniref:DUF420 domain-containing protein n=1 Tax=Exiguobacterium alkaliphilum TaxID=1428684 RepID=A0ABT2KU34_9BACL|nr:MULTISPECIES: DUF420 domain-containing protein [Exiguobacterium]KDN58910.1 membrane protein [Exiguobacterium sp. AB2]MCT4794493.1 DUF420 domain-containing protein [Exiguobacterium alkaliphilum]QUE85750.1 DUF420 domain-containing protein [Exiguobacterium alkaliphilum]